MFNKKTILILLFILLFILILVLAYISGINCGLGHIFSGSGENDSEKKSINWENNTLYDSEKIINIAEFIENNIPDFEPLNKQELGKLKKYAQSNKLALGQLISLRHIIATQKSIDVKKKSYKYHNDFKNFYRDNFTKNKPNTSQIKNFFKMFPIPPLEIVKILKENSLEINPEFQKYAEEHDSENQKTYKQILLDADAFENNLVDYLKKNYPSIKFKTQLELVEDQTKRFGRPFATPDILFDNPIIVKVSGNTHLIRWIDAKNYTLINVPFIMQSIHKQADKYMQNYGPGALAFHYGMSDNVKIPHTLLLNCSFIK